MEKLNKKGFFQTAEWLVAGFIIVFLLIIFLMLSSMLIYYKTIEQSLSPSEADFKQMGFVDVASGKSFESFSRLEISSGIDKKKVYDIVANANLQDPLSEKFKEKALIFLKFVIQDKYYGGWVRIYDSQNKEYENYQTYTSDCNPNDSSSSTYALFFGNNKIILCLRI